MKIVFRFETTINFATIQDYIESVESDFTNSDNSVYIKRVAVFKSSGAPCLLLSIDPIVMLTH